MLISYHWLSEYFEKPLPAPEKLVELLSMHAFEVEGVEERDGDTIIDVDVLPNRAHDALSYVGMAREMAVLTDISLKLPNPQYKTDQTLKSEEHIDLVIEDHKKVPRAMKRLISDITVGESPLWLKDRLSAIGQKSINNVVDISNFVMFETGQPVHAFDYDKLAGSSKKRVIVRGATQGELLQTLTGETYELEEGMLVWADTEKALDIAGTKGGLNSGVDDNTKRIMLSICNFEPINIRKTSKKLGLMTDASKRYENGITPELTAVAMERMSGLIAEIAGGRVSEDILDVYPKDIARTAAPFKIGVSLNEINSVLGTELSDSDVTSILDRFAVHAGFSYETVTPLQKALETAQNLVGTPYKWGASVAFDGPRYFDCSSFINYCFVQAGIALPRMTVDQYMYTQPIEKTDLQPGDLVFSRSVNNNGEKELHVERLGHAERTLQTVSREMFPGTPIEGGLDHAGIYLGEGNVIHATRGVGKVVIEPLQTAEKFQDIVGYRRVITNNDPRYVVSVPYERLDLRAGPGFSIAGNKEDLIEEIGRVYGYENIKPTIPSFEKTPEIHTLFYYSNIIRDVLVNEGFSEVLTYPLVEKGNVELQNPLASDKGSLREGLREGLLKSLELNKHNAPLLGLDTIHMFEIGSVFSKEGEHMALGITSSDTHTVERVREMLSKELGVAIGGSTTEGVFEVNLTELLKKLPSPQEHKNFDVPPTITYSPISAYPFVLRDIAVWTAPNTQPNEVEEIIKEKAGELLVRIDLFDQYTNPKDRRTSYAFHLVFQSPEKTLTDDEVNTFMERVTNALHEKKEWEVR